MSVVRYDLAALRHHVEQYPFCGASLVRRNDVLVSEYVLDRVTEAVVTFAPGVALVPFHDGTPLVGGHCAGARVGEQIDQDVIGREKKEVVVRVTKQLFAFLARSPADRFNALNAKRLDNGAGRHSKPSVAATYQHWNSRDPPMTSLCRSSQAYVQIAEHRKNEKASPDFGWRFVPDFLGVSGPLNF